MCSLLLVGKGLEVRFGSHPPHVEEGSLYPRNAAIAIAGALAAEGDASK
jgi:hypothetical protein